MGKRRQEPRQRTTGGHSLGLHFPRGTACLSFGRQALSGSYRVTRGPVCCDKWNWGFDKTDAKKTNPARPGNCLNQTGLERKFSLSC